MAKFVRSEVIWFEAPESEIHVDEGMLEEAITAIAVSF
jgi:hypothetical protein